MKSMAGARVRMQRGVRGFTPNPAKGCGWLFRSEARDVNEALVPLYYL